MIKKILFSLLFVIFCLFYANAQTGTAFTYTFLKLSPSAHITALGGNNVTIVNHDPSITLNNPAAINPTMHRSVMFSTVIYPGRTNFGNASYTHHFGKPGTWQFGIQYMAYGNMKETDETGQVTGNFNAGDVNIYGGGSWSFAKILSVGANMKFIYSQLGPFSSLGFGTDIGFTVNDSSKLVTASLVARNLGSQFKPYRAGNFEPLPFDLIAGLSFGIKKTPFRIHVNIHDLHNWKLSYQDPNDNAGQDLFTSDSTSREVKVNVGDEIMRHFIFGLEVNIKKIVRITLAYNHQRQKELTLLYRRGAPGLSGGLGLKIKQFNFGYGFSLLSQGASLHHLTLSINTAGFVKKKG